MHYIIYLSDGRTLRVRENECKKFFADCDFIDHRDRRIFKRHIVSIEKDTVSEPKYKTIDVIEEESKKSTRK